MRPGRRITGISAAAPLGRRVCAFLAGAFLCLPAYADVLDELAPCLTPKTSVQAYADAFVARGWSLAKGAMRDRVGEATGEISQAILMMTSAFLDRADAVDFLEHAHVRGARMLNAPAAVALVQDDRNLLIDLTMLGQTTWSLQCILTGRSLADVRAGTPDEPGMIGTNELAFNSAEVTLPAPPPGMEKIRIDMIRLFFPILARLLVTGGDAVYLSAGFSADPVTENE